MKTRSYHNMYFYVIVLVSKDVITRNMYFALRDFSTRQGRYVKYKDDDVLDVMTMIMSFFRLLQVR